MMNKNPLLTSWNTPYKIAPFDEILDSHFYEAVERAMEYELQEIQEISENSNPQTYENNIQELLKKGK